MKRRDAIKTAALGAGLIGAGLPGISSAQNDLKMNNDHKLKGNINHSVCRWCYNSIPLEEFCEQAAGLEIKSVELTRPDEWPTLDKYGLTCAVATESFANIARGWNRPERHEELTKSYLGLVDQAADKGVPTVIVFSGNRDGMADDVGMENCAKGLDTLVKHAEKRGVTVIMELLNSKVNHKDYMCDFTPWGVALVEKIGSPNFKLLYDIYHMQIMEGDIIATIRDNKDYIAHYHTGGVPGRHEINETQELYYPAIMKAIVETGYKGYVAQEFVPSWEDKIAALKEGVQICDV